MNEDKKINVISFKRDTLYHVSNTTNKQLNALRKQIELLQGENKGLTSARVQSEELRLRSEGIVLSQNDLINSLNDVVTQKDVLLDALMAEIKDKDQVIENMTLAAKPVIEEDKV